MVAIVFAKREIAQLLLDVPRELRKSISELVGVNKNASWQKADFIDRLQSS